MEITKKVFVFADSENSSPTPGKFDQWCAFAESEHHAQIKIQSRYNLQDRNLRLLESYDDRRRPNDRRSLMRRNWVW